MQQISKRFVLRRPATTWVIWLMAGVYVAAHVPFLAKTPFDVDGVNFTLALHEYDLTKHQPHPPGSPLFVGLGRIARTTLPSLPEDAASIPARRALDAAALAIWSACFGALAAFGVFRLMAALGQPLSRAVLTTALTLATPLFWFSGIRPMSDLPGLALALLALGLLAPSLMHRMDAPVTSPAIGLSPAALLLGCFLAGLSPGMRVQMAWLTWPAVMVAIVASALRRERVAFMAAGAWALGVVAWLVPLSLIVGGPREYFRLLRVQGAEDVTAGQMLALSLTPRNAVRALQDSLLAPWGEPSLGIIALVAATIGGLYVLATRRRTAAVLALVFGPYAILHLGFHDTSHIRYALPLVPLVAVLAVEGFALFGHRIAAGATLVLVTAALSVAFVTVIGHSRRAAPVYQALDEVRGRLSRNGDIHPVVAMHHSVALALRGERMPAPVLASPVRYEWLELAKYWRAGGDAPVWFLASKRRTDLALIDRYSRSLVRSFPYPERSRALMAGSRPRSVEWVEVRPPGWIALEGWSLTPEVRGVTVREYMRNRLPIATALVRRRRDEVAMLLGGRNLGGPCSTGANVRVSIDGRDIAHFSTRAGESFARLWRIPPDVLTGEGPFARLEVVAEDRSGAGQQVDVAFEQFDVQSAGHAILGLGEGWFEPEYDEREGVGYRWMSERATVRLDTFERDVMLRIRGESPRREFQQSSTIVIRSGDEVLDTQQVHGDFEITLRVPARTVRAAAGAVDIETSQSFVPDERSGNGDQRVLALRIFDVDARVPDAALAQADVTSAHSVGQSGKGASP